MSLMNPSIIAAFLGRVIRAFNNSSAFNEASAKTLNELGISRFHHMVNMLIRRGHITKTGDGRYYMNKAYYESWKRRTRFVLPIVISIIVIGVILTLIFTR